MHSIDAISMANAAQREASNPYISAWVAASAGSGKTKVLTDRVLNLLLCNYPPEKILCLTFTKTAAAEMANRLSEILRKWAVLDDISLTQVLIELKGEDFEQEHLKLARQLFAKLLEVKGGMKIMTIHSFCQSLLKRFPIEAGLSPTFEVLDDKESHFYMNKAISNTLKEISYIPEISLISSYINEKNFTELMKTFDSERNLFKRLLESHQSLSSLIHKVYKTLNIIPGTTVQDIQKLIYEGDDFESFKLHYLTKENEIRKKLPPKDIPTATALLDILDKIKLLVPFNMPSIDNISAPAISKLPTFIEGKAPPVVHPIPKLTLFLSAIFFKALYSNNIGPLLPVTTFIPFSIVEFEVFSKIKSCSFTPFSTSSFFIISASAIFSLFLLLIPPLPPDNINFFTLPSLYISKAVSILYFCSV